MNLRTIAAAILATVFCTGLAMAATPSADEWSDIAYVQGRWSRIYFDYQQAGGADTGRFYCINDWVVNKYDTCRHGGLVCADTGLAKTAVCFQPPLGTPDSCEANLFQFKIGAEQFTIKVYKNGTATIDPFKAGLEGKFSWNPSVNWAIDHTIWEFSFPIRPCSLINFTGHDPAVPTDTVWPAGPVTPFSTGPSAIPHNVDGLFAGNDNHITPLCSPLERCYIPDSLLPKDPRIPPLTIILHEGGGVTIIPEGTIPTLSEWGAIIFGTLLLASVAFYIWRRRRVVTV